MAKRVELKSAAEIAKMRRAGLLLRSVFDEIEAMIAPGVRTAQLDRVARARIECNNAAPAFLGYKGYPATLCTSVNDEIVHGIPNDKPLNEGDIVSIDCGLVLDGFYADRALTFPVGAISESAQRLLQITSESLEKAIDQIRPDNRIGDVSSAVQRHVEAAGYSVVRDYTGHGIGRSMHEPPQVLNYGEQGTGLRLKPGMVLAVEPMVNIGTYKTKEMPDGWTVKTADGSLSAHFEHTIAVTEDGPVVLTGG